MGPRGRRQGRGVGASILAPIVVWKISWSAMLTLVACAHARDWQWQVVAGNNLAGSGIKPGVSVLAAGVYFNGTSSSVMQCQLQCEKNESCASFAWASGQNAGSDKPCNFTGDCYLRTTAVWAPRHSAASACEWTSGRKIPVDPNTTTTTMRNVLYIVVDDLRPQLGCYGHNDTVKTPHIDQLARTGALFRHAYVQIAVCSPSRTSVLTGLRPHQSNVLNFATDFRRATPGGAAIVPLPEFFKRAGALSTGLGKVWHPGLPKNNDNPRSWSPDFPYFDMDHGCRNGTSPWCSDDDDVPPEQYADGQIVSEALRRLNAIVATYSRPPTSTLSHSHSHLYSVNPLQRAFFMAVGLHRPHMDWVVPPSFLARQPEASAIRVASHRRFEQNETAWAFYNCSEMTSRARLRTQGARIEPGSPLSTALSQEIRRHYYAAIEYMDSQVGRLLDGLEDLNLTESTAVVLHGDHGWKLGEMGQWCKETVYEHDTRTPLVIRAPWLRSRRQSARSESIVSQVVELVDLFPTIAELAGLEDDGNTPFQSALPPQLTGQSLVPLLKGKPSNVSAVAFSIYPRWQRKDDHSHCFKPYNQIQAVGLSVRTANFRLTDWVAWDANNTRPHINVTGSWILATELYNHETDDGMGPASFDDFEFQNLAADPGLAPVVVNLRALLRAHFGLWPARPLANRQM